MKKRIIISVLLLIIICAVGIMSYSPLRNKIEQIFFATKVYNLLNSEEYYDVSFQQEYGWRCRILTNRHG